MRLIWLKCFLLFLTVGFTPSGASAMSVQELSTNSHQQLLCSFEIRCGINLSRDKARRVDQGYSSDTQGTHCFFEYGRWKRTSVVRAFLITLRETVTSHPNVPDASVASYPIQYAANPAAQGCFFRESAKYEATGHDGRRVQHNKRKR